jgi:hypothetical protein
MRTHATRLNRPDADDLVVRIHADNSRTVRMPCRDRARFGQAPGGVPGIVE